MSIYSAGLRTTNTTSANATVEIIAGASLPFRLLELGITINAATASVFTFAKSATIGGTPATTNAPVKEDGGNTATPAVNTAMSWTTGPVLASVFNRRVSLPATIGSGIIWTFPRGFNCLQANTLVLANAATNSVADVWLVVDE